MQMLVAAWDAVTTKTDVNRFRNSKISSESQEAAIVEDDDPFKALEEEIENLLLMQLYLVSENMDAALFTDVDAEILVVQYPHSDSEIIAELLEMGKIMLVFK